jgi:hypothetical protein
MPIVFLHPCIPDYAGDGLFHGLRTILGEGVVDFPRMDYMYSDYPAEKWKGVANEGKILYGLLDDNDTLCNLRARIDDVIRAADAIVISQPNGFRQALSPIMQRIKRGGAEKKIVWIDGSDGPLVFPFHSFRKTIRELAPALLWPMSRWLYFKREYAGKEAMAPFPISHLLRNYRMYPLSISIPEHHISEIPFFEKSKDFPDYLVDEELAALLGVHHGVLGKHSFIFKDESSYLADVAASRYGITTRRSGWDALRHYEYAAKGAILCFRHLDKKPAAAAPFGLNETNCIVYDHARDLLKKIKSLSSEEMTRLSENSLLWAKDHTTVAEAGRFLKVVSEEQLFLP